MSTLNLKVNITAKHVFVILKLVLYTQTGHRVSTAFFWEVMVDKPGPGPLQDADVSRTPSPQGQESERESQEGDSEARVANIFTGGLITLSTLLLSGLLFEQHYSLTGHRLPGNYTAEGETWCTRPQQKVPKKVNTHCHRTVKLNLVSLTCPTISLHPPDGLPTDRKPKTITFWDNVWNDAWFLTVS